MQVIAIGLFEGRLLVCLLRATAAMGPFGPALSAIAPGLDPTVVVRKDERSRNPGVAPRRPVAVWLRRQRPKPSNALGESEEEQEGEPLGTPKAGDPVSEAVIALLKILSSMQKDKAKGKNPST